MSLQVDAPAKLNLCLNVVGRREDGYHRLDSLFAFVELADGLTIGPSAAAKVSIRGEFAPDLDLAADDLAARARDLVFAEAGSSPTLAIAIDKRIPVAAGLGGGSADAAATIRALNDYLRLGWPLERLQALASRLGADAPACILSSPAIARGVGDELTPAPAMPPCGVLLVNPRVATPTPTVFRAFRSLNPVVTEKIYPDLPGRFDDLQALVAAIEPRGNDLLPAALGVTPVIARVLERLRAMPDAAYAGLSGSGATCFALFETADAARRAAENVRTGDGWWTWAGGWHQPARRLSPTSRPPV